jgi:ribonuclease HII
MELEAGAHAAASAALAHEATSNSRQPSSRAPAVPAATASAAAARVTGGLSLAWEVGKWSGGQPLVAGIDEAGRGPLAGPVVAAALMYTPPSGARASGSSSSSVALPPVPGVNDSKQLTAEQREALYAALTSHPSVHWGVSVQEHTVVDDINILQVRGGTALRLEATGVGCSFVWPRRRGVAVLRP